MELNGGKFGRTTEGDQKSREGGRGRETGNCREMPGHPKPAIGGGE